jgi:hypothetical protein
MAADNQYATLEHDWRAVICIDRQISRLRNRTGRRMQDTLLLPHAKRGSKPSYIGTIGCPHINVRSHKWVILPISYWIIACYLNARMYEQIAGREVQHTFYYDTSLISVHGKIDVISDIGNGFRCQQRIQGSCLLQRTV